MKHQAAYAPSRPLPAEVDNTELEDKIPVMVVSRMKNQHSRKRTVMPSRKQKKKLLPNNPVEYDAELPTFPEFIMAQFKDTFWEQSC